MKYSLFLALFLAIALPAPALADKQSALISAAIGQTDDGVTYDGRYFKIPLSGR